MSAVMERRWVKHFSAGALGLLGIALVSVQATPADARVTAGLGSADYAYAVPAPYYPYSYPAYYGYTPYYSPPNYGGGLYFGFTTSHHWY